MKEFLTLFSTVLIGLSFGQKTPSYKKMMYDPQYNIYEVRDSAEAYFSTIDRTKKGCGWKPFCRWYYLNEPKFYPSGDRSQTDFNAPYESFKRIQADQGKNLFPGGWNELGPYTIDNITDHYAAGLGRIEDMYAQETNTDTVYLVSRSSGFWGSYDGGQTWFGGTMANLPGTGSNSLSVHRSNPNEIYAAVQYSENNYAYGVYKSIDAGQTWQATDFVPSNLGVGGPGSNFIINIVRIHPLNPNVILVGTNRGIFRSTDGLQTWTQSNSGWNITGIAFHPTDVNKIYIINTASAGTANSVLISSDQGSSFTSGNVIPGNNGNQNTRIATSAASPNSVFFSSNSGYWRSDDQGVNFTVLSTTVEGADGFAVSDLDDNYLLTGGINLYVSSNGGADFQQRSEWYLGATNGSGSGTLMDSYNNSTDYVHADLRNADFVDGSFYVCTDGFLCKSADNGENWEILSDSISARENYSLGTCQSNHYSTICGSQDNGTSIHTKNGWIEGFGADGMEGFIHPLNPNWMIGSYQFGGRIRSFDGAQTFQSINPSEFIDAAWVAPTLFDPNNPMHIFDFREVVYESYDFGENYTEIGAPGLGDIREAAIAYNDSKIIAVSTGSNIRKSTDGGFTYSNIKGNLPNLSIRSIAFDPQDDKTMVVCYNNYNDNGQKVYISTVGGTTWSNITYNLGDIPVNSVIIDNSADRVIYAGTEVGVYYKKMSESSWTLYNPNLPNTSIQELDLCWGSNSLKAATWGRGLWEFNTVGRANYPAILETKISQAPTFTTPSITVAQYVDANIHYEGQLSQVYVEWSYDTALFNNKIPMYQLSNNQWKSFTAIPTPDDQNTFVFFRVVAIGSNQDTTETYKFVYEVLEDNFCGGTGNIGSVDDPRITSTQIAGITQNSVDNDYILYSTPVRQFFIDSSYNIAMTVNTAILETDFAAWIDENDNQIFEANENIFNFTNPNTLSVNSTYTVPNTVNLNDTVVLRMRASFSATAISPCGVQEGEVEDYLVVFRSPVQINHTVNTTNACAGTDIIFNYTGTNVDSVKWTLSSNSNVYTNTGNSVNFNSLIGGTYSLYIVAYKNGVAITKNTLNYISITPTLQSEISQFSCSDIIWNGLTLTQTGDYQVLLSNAQGCDSIAIMHFYKNEVPVSAIQYGPTYMVEVTADSYQWLDCDNGYAPIAGATAQTFAPSGNGEFAVAISSNGCIDTSECLVLTTFGIDSDHELNYFTVAPNPVENVVTISLLTKESAVLIVKDLNGKIIRKLNITENVHLDLSEIASGMYYLNLSNNRFEQTVKIIKL